MNVFAGENLQSMNEEGISKNQNYKKLILNKINLNYILNATYSHKKKNIHLRHFGMPKAEHLGF